MALIDMDYMMGSGVNIKFDTLTATSSFQNITVNRDIKYAVVIYDLDNGQTFIMEYNQGTYYDTYIRTSNPIRREVMADPSQFITVNGNTLSIKLGGTSWNANVEYTIIY